jgi:hypothetical protein
MQGEKLKKEKKKLEKQTKNKKNNPKCRGKIDSLVCTVKYCTVQY